MQRHPPLYIHKCGRMSNTQSISVEVSRLRFGDFDKVHHVYVPMVNINYSIDLFMTQAGPCIVFTVHIHVKMPKWVDSKYLRATEKRNIKQLNHSLCARWATLPRRLGPNTTVEHKLELKFYYLFGLGWCRSDVCPIGVQLVFSIIVEWQRQVCRYIWTHSTHQMRPTICFRWRNIEMRISIRFISIQN